MIVDLGDSGTLTRQELERMCEVARTGSTAWFSPSNTAYDAQFCTRRGQSPGRMTFLARTSRYSDQRKKEAKASYLTHQSDKPIAGAVIAELQAAGA